MKVSPVKLQAFVDRDVGQSVSNREVQLSSCVHKLQSNFLCRLAFLSLRDSVARHGQTKVELSVRGHMVFGCSFSTDLSPSLGWTAWLKNISRYKHFISAKIDNWLFFNFKYLKYSQTGDVTFPL